MPKVLPEVLYDLHCPSAGITSSYEFCIALMEDTIANGVKLILNAEVKDIRQEKTFFQVSTTNSEFQGKYVINWAGIDSPGLTSSSAIVISIIELLKNEGLKLCPKDDFNPYREGIAVRLTEENTLSMREVIPLTELPLGAGERIVC